MEPWLKDLTPPYIRSPIGDQGRSLLCLASVRAANAGHNATRLSTVYAGCIPLIPGYFSGVGDLFSALVLGHYHPPPLENGRSASPSPSPSPEFLPSSSSSLPPLTRAVSLALTKTHAIVRLTEKHANSLPPDERTTTDDELDKKDPERRTRRMRGRELRLVQGRKILSGEAMGELRSVREWEDFWGPN